MVQTIPAKEMTLAQLNQTFGLTRVDDDRFFLEWQTNLPELTEPEKQFLAQVKTEYLHLSEYPMLEPIVKMVVLSPLLRLAGFYAPPFYLSAEKEVRVVSEDEGTIVTGRIDVLLFTPEFWVTVVEAKKAAYSIEAAVPQVLAYMLDRLTPEKPVLGFVTNGSTFQFLKLVQQDCPQYARSDLFSLYSRDGIETVLRILKRIGQLVVVGEACPKDIG